MSEQFSNKNFPYLISSIEASKEFGVTNDYIARLCRQGKLEGSLSGGVWMVSKASLDDFFITKRAGQLGEQDAVISSREAAKRYRVTNDYISRLARQGKLRGTLKGRNWQISLTSLKEFFGEAKTLPVVETQTTQSPTLQIEKPTVRARTLMITPAVRSLTKRFSPALVLASLFIAFGAYAMIGAATNNNSAAALFGIPDALHSAYIFFFGDDKPAVVTLPPEKPVEFPQAPNATTTQLIQHNTYPITERTIMHTQSGITEETLAIKLAELSNSLQQQIYNAVHTPPPVITFPGNTIPPSPSSSGSSGILTITDADVPDTITASNYLPLAGGTVTGALAVSGLTTLGYASTTGLTISSTGSTTELIVSALGSLGTTCVQADTTGKLSSTGAACGSGGGGFPFTTTTNYGAVANATTTPIFFTNGLQASSTSHFVNADFTNATTTNASSTNIFTSNLTIGSLTGLLKATSGVVSAAVAGTDYANFAYLFPSNATTTAIAFNGGLTAAGATTTTLAVTGSSTISSVFNVGGATNLNAALTVLGGTSLQQATSTNFAITSIADGKLIKTTTNGTLGAAVAGSDYQAAGNYITTLTGDVSASGPGSAAATLATVNSDVGAFGGSTAIPTITVNGKGLVTAVSTNVVIAPAGTLTGATLAANVLASSLTSVGTLSALTVSGGTTLAGATTTALAVNGSSTISGAFNSTFANSLGSTTLIGSSLLSNATTSSLGISSIASGNLLKATTGGAIVAAVAGTDYVAGSSFFSYPFPSNATTTVIAFDGGVTAASATTTALAVNGSSTISGTFNSTFANILGSTTLSGNTLFTNATGTTLSISSIASTTALIVSNAGGVGTRCAQFDAVGTLSANASACGSGGGASFPFTTTTFGATTANATSTLMGFSAGLYSLASSTIGDGTQGGGLTISGGATTTGNAYIAGTIGVGTSSVTTATVAISNAISGLGGLLINTWTNVVNAFTIKNSAGTTVFNIDDTQASASLGIGTTTPLSTLVAAGNATIGVDYNIAAPTNGLLVQGRVGLGTTTPASVLSIAGNVNIGTDYGVAAPANGLLVQGVVGLGTTSPFGMLSVDGTAVSSAITVPQFTLKSVAAQTANVIGTYTSAGTLQFAVNATGNTTVQGIRSQAAVASGVNSAEFLAVGSTVTNNKFQAVLPANVTTGLTFSSLTSTQLGQFSLNGIGAWSIGTTSTTSTTALSIQAPPTSGNVSGYGSQNALVDVATTTSTTYATSSLFRINANGGVGIGSSTPWALLGVQGVASSTFSTLFAIGSTSNIGGTISTSTLFSVSNNGKVGIASTSPASTLTVVGSACFSVGTGATLACGTTAGNIYYTAANTGNYDVAENYVAMRETPISTSTIVSLDPQNPGAIMPAVRGGPPILGIISTAPGLLLGGADGSRDGKIVRPVALSGRVPLQVNLDGGPIAIGDTVTLSTVSGIGAKATTTVERVGIALEPYNGMGTSTIQVFIKGGTYIPPDTLALALESATTTSIASLITGSFSSASDALKSAVNSVLTGTVHMFNRAIYATSGVFNSIFAQTITVDTVQGKKLCLGGTCITESQLQSLLNAQNISTGPPPQEEQASGGGDLGETTYQEETPSVPTELPPEPITISDSPEQL